MANFVMVWLILESKGLPQTEWSTLQSTSLTSFPKTGLTKKPETSRLLFCLTLSYEDKKKFYMIDSKKVTHLKAFSNFLDFADFLEIITYADGIKLFISTID